MGSHPSASVKDNHLDAISDVESTLSELYGKYQGNLYPMHAFFPKHQLQATFHDRLLS